MENYDRKFIPADIVSIDGYKITKKAPNIQNQIFNQDPEQYIHQANKMSTQIGKILAPQQDIEMQNMQTETIEQSHQMIQDKKLFDEFKNMYKTSGEMNNKLYLQLTQKYQEKAQKSEATNNENYLKYKEDISNNTFDDTGIDDCVTNPQAIKLQLLWQEKQQKNCEEEQKQADGKQQSGAVDQLSQKIAIHIEQNYPIESILNELEKLKSLDLTVYNKCKQMLSKYQEAQSKTLNNMKQSIKQGLVINLNDLDNLNEKCFENISKIVESKYEKAQLSKTDRNNFKQFNQIKGIDNKLFLVSQLLNNTIHECMKDNKLSAQDNLTDNQLKIFDATLFTMQEYNFSLIECLICCVNERSYSHKIGMMLFKRYTDMLCESSKASIYGYSENTITPKETIKIERIPKTNKFIMMVNSVVLKYSDNIFKTIKETDLNITNSNKKLPITDRIELVSDGINTVLNMLIIPFTIKGKDKQANYTSIKAAFNQLVAVIKDFSDNQSEIIKSSQVISQSVQQISQAAGNDFNLQAQFFKSLFVPKRDEIFQDILRVISNYNINLVVDKI